MKFSTDIYVSKTMHGNSFSGPLTFPLALGTPPGYVPQLNPLVFKGVTSESKRTQMATTV